MSDHMKQSDHMKHFWWENWDRPILVHQRLIAWALIVGERPRYLDDASRPRLHRGMLPDVDFDRAMVDPNYRPLLARFADLLRRVLRRPAKTAMAETELSAELATAVGENLAASYIAEGRTGGVAIRASEDNVDPTHRSRAA